jgi:hypothetical protein
MERLRQSIENLASPICEACNIPMAWSRSALVATEQAISHIFVCSRCGSFGETKTPVKAASKE